MRWDVIFIILNTLCKSSAERLRRAPRLEYLTYRQDMNGKLCCKIGIEGGLDEAAANFPGTNVLDRPAGVRGCFGRVHCQQVRFFH